MAASRLIAKILKKLIKESPKVTLPKASSYKISSKYPLKSRGTPGVQIGKSYRGFTNRFSHLYPGKSPYWGPGVGANIGNTIKGAVPKYYERFPRKDLEWAWEYGKYSPNTLQNMIRKSYRGKAPIGRKLALMESRASSAMPIGSKVERMEALAGHRLPNPLTTRIRERLMAGRGEPGVKAGLERMRARMFDRFNQGIAPAVTQRAANFNSLIGTDKGFRAFLTDVVGAKTVQSMTPRMRDKLAKQYLSLRRRGFSGKDAMFREYLGEYESLMKNLK